MHVRPEDTSMNRIKMSKDVVSERRQSSKLVPNLSEFKSLGLYFTNIYIHFWLDEALHLKGLAFYQPNHHDSVFSFQFTKEILSYIRNGHWENRSEELNNKAKLA